MFILVVLLQIDLSSHARRSAKENDVSDAIDNVCALSALAHEDGNGVANACQALHAVVESNDLIVRRLWLERILDHELQPGRRDGQTCTYLHQVETFGFGSPGQQKHSRHIQQHLPSPSPHKAAQPSPKPFSQHDPQHGGSQNPWLTQQRR